MSKQKIIFLDIDGPLLPLRAFITKHNERVINHATKIKNRSQHLQYYAENIKFDEIAVALVNRLCSKARAKIVIISNWRNNIGPEQTLLTLQAQGIESVHFHSDPICPKRGFTSEKVHDLFAWLSSNGYSYKDLYENFPLYSSPFVVIDDESHQFNRHTNIGKCISPTLNDGFGLKEYRIALALLGGCDHHFDVYKLTEEEAAPILECFDNDYDAATYWLYDMNSMDRIVPPASLLSMEAAKQTIEHSKLRLMGFERDRCPASLQESRASGVLRAAKEFIRNK